MKRDYTHISVILDRTGSMESIRDDTIGGFNSFLADQKSQAGEASLTLVQFDSQDPHEVICHFKPIHEVPELDRNIYVPRASTPLLDALGREINELEQSIAHLQEEDRPSKVVFVVITDGQENASTEFRKEQVERMIKERTEKDDWQFVFLSADLGAINDAMSYGIQQNSAMYFDKTGLATRAAWNDVSVGISDYRSAKKRKIGFRPNETDSGGAPKKK